METKKIKRPRIKSIKVWDSKKAVNKLNINILEADFTNKESVFNCYSIEQNNPEAASKLRQIFYPYKRHLKLERLEIVEANYLSKNPTTGNLFYDPQKSSLRAQQLKFRNLDKSISLSEFCSLMENKVFYSK